MKLNILFLITFLSLWNVSIAQSLKIYSGKYREGTATYSYKDNPAGGRIYEGSFVYTTPYRKITGQFKNNKKDGQWIYKGYKKSLKLSYKDGVLDGMYQFINGGDNACTLLLTIKDGKFVGSVKGVKKCYTWNGSFRYWGSFSGQFDENGYMDGNWTFEDDDSVYVFHATYEHGVCQKCYREDITTGDITQGVVEIDLHSIIMDNFTAIEKQVDRGHSSWHKYDYEIGQKSFVSDEEIAIRRRIQEAFGRRSSPAVGASSRSINTVEGVEGSRVGGNAFDLSGRSLVGGLPRPSCNVTEEGCVVVDITVNPAGYVIATGINSQTNTSSTYLCKAAMKAAQKARFNAIDCANNQVGTITYYFQLR